MGHSLYFDEISLTGDFSPYSFSPYHDWLLDYFPQSTGVADIDLRDDDRDGRPVLMEYAMGSDPNVPDSSIGGLDISLPGSSSIELRFPYNTGHLDIVYRLTQSLDGGQNWSVLQEVKPSGTDAWLESVSPVLAPQSGSVLYRLEVDKVRLVLR